MPFDTDGSAAALRSNPPRRPADKLRNIYTSAPKRGGYGMPWKDMTLGEPPKYYMDVYQGGKEREKVTACRDALVQGLMPGTSKIHLAGVFGRVELVGSQRTAAAYSLPAPTCSTVLWMQCKPWPKAYSSGTVQTGLSMHVCLSQAGLITRGQADQWLTNQLGQWWSCVSPLLLASQLSKLLWCRSCMQIASLYRAGHLCPQPAPLGLSHLTRSCTAMAA